MTNRRAKGPEQLGKIARRVLQDLRHAGRPAVERTAQIADAPKSAGARGPVDDVPTVGRPAIVAKDAERE